jgi:repressor LexA
MVQVQGDSMINAGIFDSDMLIVRQQDTAVNRDIVVALLDDSVTVKTFFKEKDIIRLQPENDSMAPIYVKEVQILGKVVGLYRNY